MAREGRANLAIGAAVLTALATAPAGWQAPMQPELQGPSTVIPAGHGQANQAASQAQQAAQQTQQARHGQANQAALQAQQARPDTQPARQGQAIQTAQQANPAAVSSGALLASFYGSQQPAARPEPAGLELAERQQKRHLRPRVYTVMAGDNPWTIARHHGVPYEFFLEFNGLSADQLIYPGQELLVPSAVAVASGKVARPIQLAQTQTAETAQAPQRAELAAAQTEGRVKVSRGGVRGERPVLLDEMIATTPFARWPADGEVTDRYGWRVHPVRGGYHLHDGVDIANGVGTPIYAVAAGTVSFAGWQDGWGLMVDIDHENGLTTRYAHASRLLVADGDTVEAGELIARMGATGIATGSHLHFSIRVGGSWVDPEEYLP